MATPLAHEKFRELPALKAGDARLVAARLGAGDEAVHALTWRIAADFNKDDYDQWITEVEKDDGRALDSLCPASQRAA